MNLYFLQNSLVHEQKDEKETKCGLPLTQYFNSRRVSKLELGKVIEVEAPVTCKLCQ